MQIFGFFRSYAGLTQNNLVFLYNYSDWIRKLYRSQTELIEGNLNVPSLAVVTRVHFWKNKSRAGGLNSFKQKLIQVVSLISMLYGLVLPGQ
jgi:hypothetical protein